MNDTLKDAVDWSKVPEPIDTIHFIGAGQRAQTVTLPEVTLTLTDAEAKTLASILFSIGGHPVHSPRQHADSIDKKLNAAGYTRRFFTSTGSIVFPNR